MKSATMRLLCRILIVSMMALPFQAAQAGMIGTQKAVAAGAQTDRDAVLNIVSRPDVAGQLQSLGLDPATAKARVAAMTDEEVRSLNGQLDSLPAGAKVSGGTWLALIVIGAVVWYYWK